MTIDLCQPAEPQTDAAVPPLYKEQLAQPTIQPEMHPPARDLIIGCFFGYEWTIVRYWANSIEMCGFSGDRAVIVYNTDTYTLDRLEALGFRVYHYDPAEIESGYGYSFEFRKNYGHRFPAYYEQLSRFSDIDQYRYVIATDVKDVVFQTDPSSWLAANLGDKKVCASCESLLYRDEPWGDQCMRRAYPRLYNRMASRPIWNCGVQAGDIRVMKDFWLQLAMSNVAGLAPADQAAYNILLSLRPWSEMTLFTMSEHGWACQVGTTADPRKMERFRPNLLEPEPRWDGVYSTTSKGQRHVILHQYNRHPEWQKAVQLKYGVT